MYLSNWYALIGNLISLVRQTGGFNQKLASVVDRITKEMKSLIDNVDDDKIRTTIDAYIRALDERVQYAVADGLTYALVCVHSVSTFEIKQHVRRIQMDDLKTFCRDLWKQMRVIAIMQGNMTEEIAQSIMQTTLTNINCGKIDDVSFCETLSDFGTHFPLRSFSAAEFNDFTWRENARRCTLSPHQINGSQKLCRSKLLRNRSKNISHSCFGRFTSFGLLSIGLQYSPHCRAIGLCRRFQSNGPMRSACLFHYCRIESHELFDRFR